ncbi:DivIVA domain-containing protein [Streptomyces sp. 7N604]|uniref:DivIVA domain-containing protein n=1 Tax=Streptomyces sp. 7N604 TaxID=3457415 RepID=UPI003FD12AE0
MFWFLLIALVAVVAAVTLIVVGGDDGVALPDAQPDRLDDPLPADRPVARADVEALRLPMTVRGYRMADVDDVLGRLGAELAERDARIAELEAALAGAQASAMGGSSLLKDRGGQGEYREDGRREYGGPRGGYDAGRGEYGAGRGEYGEYGDEYGGQGPYGAGGARDERPGPEGTRP